MPGSSFKSWEFHGTRPVNGLKPARRAGKHPRTSGLEIFAAENARLRRENHQLRDTNELLKAASAFSPQNQAHNVKKLSGLSMSTGVIFSALFICKTLKNNRAGGFITSREYRQSKARGLRARRLCDAVLIQRSSAVYRDNYGAYGVRKIWHGLRRDEN